MDKFINQKRCPKCRGNLYLDTDQYGWYEQCLQCGFIGDLRAVYEDDNGYVFSTIEKLEYHSNDN